MYKRQYIDLVLNHIKSYAIQHELYIHESRRRSIMSLVVSVTGHYSARHCIFGIQHQWRDHGSQVGNERLGFERGVSFSQGAAGVCGNFFSRIFLTERRLPMFVGGLVTPVLMVFYCLQLASITDDGVLGD